MKHLLIILSVVSTSLFALSKEQLNQIQTNLESRINPIVRTFDPDAILFVKLRTERRTSRVSLIPFLMDNISVPGESITSLQKVEIVLLSAKTELPKPIIALLKEIASDMGVRVSVKLRPIPDELNRSLLQQKENERLRSDLSNMPPLPAYQRAFNLLKSPAAIPLAILLGTLILAAVMLRLFWYLRKGTEELSTGLGQVAQALETGSVVPDQLPISVSNPPMIPIARPNRENQAAPLTPQNGNMITPDLAMLALFADCYWSKFDSYAAFLWKQIPAPQKGGLIEAAAFVKDYSSWLTEVPAADLGVDQETYYAEPLPIYHLDNGVLTGLVRENPALMYKLPFLRRSGLELSLQEKIEVTKRAFTENLLPLPDFENLPASLPRSLNKRISIPLNSVAEETQVLELKDAPVALVENLPTLGWWSRLPEKDLADVLSKFSARELASAWIGPEEVLALFARALPRHKYIMVLAYLRRLSPSRSSLTYKYLHQQAVRQLEKSMVVAPITETAVTEQTAELTEETANASTQSTEGYSSQESEYSDERSIELATAVTVNLSDVTPVETPLKTEETQSDTLASASESKGESTGNGNDDQKAA